MVSIAQPMGGGELGDLRTLALAVLRQSVDDIRFRPYMMPRHLCCPDTPDRCAHRFLKSRLGETWCDVAGVSLEAVRVRLDADTH